MQLFEKSERSSVKVKMGAFQNPQLFDQPENPFWTFSLLSFISWFDQLNYLSIISGRRGKKRLNGLNILFIWALMKCDQEINYFLLSPN